MRRVFPRPMGDVSRRVHGVMLQLRARQASASDAAKQADEDGLTEFAASLRGKARGYSEAVDLLVMLDLGRSIPRRSRWTPSQSAPEESA